MNKMPVVYPEGGPLYWRNESSGQMAQALMAFLNRPHSITPEELTLIIDYFSHWINAPCWCQSPVLRRLRDRLRGVSTVKELTEWYHDSCEIGIDPV